MEKITDGFEKRWNFYNCLGAIDGKHVVIQARQRAGSIYYNCKGTRSILLMAVVVNDHYQFTIGYIGDVGRQSDDGIFSAYNLGFAVNSGKLPVPDPRKVSEFHIDLSYVFIGDEVFPFKPFLIKTYSEKCLGFIRKSI